MATNCQTQTLYSDNGTTFREKGFLKFMGALGIEVAATTVFNSKARGQVEVFNFILEKVLKGLLVTKGAYEWSDVLWLASLFLNNAQHPSTKVKPVEAVFGKGTTNSLFNLPYNAPLKKSAYIRCVLKNSS